MCSRSDDDGRLFRRLLPSLRMLSVAGNVIRSLKIEVLFLGRRFSETHIVRRFPTISYVKTKTRDHKHSCRWPIFLKQQYYNPGGPCNIRLPSILQEYFFNFNNNNNNNNKSQNGKLAP